MSHVCVCVCLCVRLSPGVQMEARRAILNKHINQDDGDVSWKKEDGFRLHIKLK